MYKDAGGVWHQDRFRPLIAALVNLLFNLIFVRVWGIYAILLSTIVSYIFVSMPWMMHNVFKYVFKRSWKHYLLDMLLYFGMAFAIALLCFFICNQIPKVNLMLNVVVNCIISVLVSNIVLFIVFRGNKYYNQMIELIERITHKKLSRLKYIKNNSKE